MGPIYQLLGLTVGWIETARSTLRRGGLACDVTYGTAKEFGFDFLRDELYSSARRRRSSQDLEQVDLGGGSHHDGQMPVQGTHHFVLVDEADSILIDEARTPLIIGATSADPGRAAAYYGADQLAPRWSRQGLQLRPAERKAELTAAGRRKVQAVAANPAFVSLTVDGLYEYVERAPAGQFAFLKIATTWPRRRDRHRRRVHRPMSPAANGGTAFTRPSRPRNGSRSRWKRSGGANHRARLFPALHEAGRHDRHRVLRRRRTAADLQGRRRQGADEPARPPRWLPDRIFSTADERFQAVVEEFAELNTAGGRS